ncbi:MAG: hypothetical protein WCQ60_00765 [bacterium]
MKNETTNTTASKESEGLALLKLHQLRCSLGAIVFGLVFLGLSFLGQHSFGIINCGVIALSIWTLAVAFSTKQQMVWKVAIVMGTFLCDAILGYNFKNSYMDKSVSNLIVIVAIVAIFYVALFRFYLKHQPQPSTKG